MRRHSLTRTLSTTVLGIGLAVLAASSCSLITDSDIAPGGIGMACSSDDDCQGTKCDQGACIATCSADGDCPAPTKCWGGRCAIGSAVGSACESNANCQGARCDDGICVTLCTDGTGSAECPEESECFSSACQRRLKVAGVWVGVVGTGEGWTLTHHEGIQAAQQNLGYLDFEFKEGLIGEDAAAAIDEFVANGAEVIIANSFDHRVEVDTKAAEYPDVKFLICSGKAKEPNVGSYFGNLEQAWFVAGRLAAKKTQTRRLGFIGSYVTPEVVRHLNAFALGARKEDPTIVVEVRWLGFWYDPDFATPQFRYKPLHMGSDNDTILELTAEEYLTAKLIDSGVDVIGHQCDNQLPSRYVANHTDDGTMLDANDEPKQVYTIANDNRYGWRDAAGDPLTHAFGAVYWNWEPLYTRILSDIHRNKWTPTDVVEPLINDEEQSIVGFELSTGEPSISNMTVREFLGDEEERGPAAVFTGPITTTGQRASIPAGTPIDDAEYRSMCWFVQGVVERSNPNDPASPDQPAKVPDDQHVGKLGDKSIPATGARQPTTAPEVLFSFVPDAPAAMWNCKDNQ